MARVYRVNGYIIDEHDIINESDIERVLNAKAKDDSPLVGRHIRIDKSDEFSWNDSIAIANGDCGALDLADCVDGTGNWSTTLSDERVKVGKIYRHFKGYHVKVLAVARDTEDGHASVVYQQIGGSKTVWSRPYNMFVSKVDKEKYPDADQEYRFELMQDTSM